MRASCDAILVGDAATVRNGTTDNGADQLQLVGAPLFVGACRAQLGVTVAARV